MKIKLYTLFLSISLIVLGCDAYQTADGHIVDKETKMPIDSVAIGKGEKEDTAKPYTERIYSKKSGSFHYTGIGMTNNVELYFSKTGYKTIKIEYTSSNRPDTVYLGKAIK